LGKQYLVNKLLKNSFLMHGTKGSLLDRRGKMRTRVATEHESSNLRLKKLASHKLHPWERRTPPKILISIIEFTANSQFKSKTQVGDRIDSL
jgi:hypothetical protein